METLQSSASDSVRHLILGTAGHIDHGKTALVRALTGTNTDRLPEEQKRGMTIELGFAELVLPNHVFGIVDVPGHEKFVRTMVSGATAIDLALLVVAADDSVMPQTTEHVEILSLLGIRHAVVAITKCDLVDAELVEMVQDDIRTLLQDTSMKSAEIVPVSSISGEGIDLLRTKLVETANDIPPRPVDPPFHMSVDRAFTIQGRGTVVTGSVLRGQVNVGDTLEVHPGREECRVRDLQAHGSHHEHLQTGQRAAINLIGVDRDAVARGCDLATPGYLDPSRMLDVQIALLPSGRRSIKPSTRTRLCIGTRECIARIIPFGNRELSPAETGYAQLRLGEPVSAYYGQRFILRDESATRTIAGGKILRPVARRWLMRNSQHELDALTTLSDGDLDQRVEDVLRRAGFSALSDNQICSRAGIASADLSRVLDKLDESGRRIEVGNRKIATQAIHDVCQRSLRWLERYHALKPDEPGCRVDMFQGWLDRKSEKGMGKILLDRMAEEKNIRLLGQYACLPAYAPQLSRQDEKTLAAMLEEYRQAGFAPPKHNALQSVSDASRTRIDKLLKIAEATRQLIPVGGGWFLHPDCEAQLRATVSSLAAENPETGITVSQIRERLQSSRKYVVPFVEYLDRIGFTQREGDFRKVVPGWTEAS